MREKGGTVRGAGPLRPRVRLLRWLGRLFHAGTLLVALGILALLVGIVAVLVQASWGSLFSGGRGS